MGRDFRDSLGKKILGVSIHAPAWGATIENAIRLTKEQVSIHAPAWGATSRHWSARAHGMFQSTRPHGARLRAVLHVGHNLSFNPRARMGRDLASTAGRTCTGRFNPRARMGRDARIYDRIKQTSVSIHAPAWGATLLDAQDENIVRFNPRARMGRDE